jgi:hypothetical protein
MNSSKFPDHLNKRYWTEAYMINDFDARGICLTEITATMASGRERPLIEKGVLKQYPISSTPQTNPAKNAPSAGIEPGDRSRKHQPGGYDQKREARYPVHALLHRRAMPTGIFPAW